MKKSLQEVFFVTILLMTKIIDGKHIANELTGVLSEQVTALKAQGIVPKLVNVGINPDERALMYIRLKGRLAEEIGVEYQYLDWSGRSQEDCLAQMARLASDSDVHGIIVQLPMHNWYDPQSLLNLIPTSKDVDGLSDQSLLAIKADDATMIPATPLAVLELMKRSGIELDGKTVAIVGQGKLVGLPLGIILQNQSIDVLTADVNTKDLADITLQADVIVSATGQPGLITGELVARDSIVIDAGIVEVGGEIRGDVDRDSVEGKVSILSPVPGGVGPLTVVMLLQNTISAAKENSRLNQSRAELKS